jgi:hypothetical protein
MNVASHFSNSVSVNAACPSESYSPRSAGFEKVAPGRFCNSWANVPSQRSMCPPYHGFTYGMLPDWSDWYGKRGTEGGAHIPYYLRVHLAAMAILARRCLSSFSSMDSTTSNLRNGLAPLRLSLTEARAQASLGSVRLDKFPETTSHPRFHIIWHGLMTSDWMSTPNLTAVRSFSVDSASLPLTIRVEN